jgi:hypothetical protein
MTIRPEEPFAYRPRERWSPREMHEAPLLDDSAPATPVQRRRVLHVPRNDFVDSWRTFDISDWRNHRRFHRALQ